MHMRVRSFFPFLPTLQSYTRGDLRADIMAAATVTPMAIPQAMAYALMAGVHPQYGIYACMLPVIMAALWGCSRFMAAGPTNAISVVLFSTMATVSVGGATLASLPEAARMPYIFTLALLCGLIQLGMGLARIGDLANYISHSVMVAFGSGLAFLIAGSQLKTALAIALLGAVQSLAIGKQMAGIRGDKFDGSQELIGQGLANIAAGLTSGIPGCGSFTRSAPMVALGARTRMASVFSGLLALPMLFVLSPMISRLPMPALAGVLLLISVQTLDPRAIRLCLVATRVDRAVLLLTFAATLLLDLEQAIFVGVLVSLLLYIYKTSHPRVIRLRPDDPLLRNAPPDMPPGVAVYVIEGTLFFGAIHELERQLEEEDREPARLVVLSLTRVFWLDASGAHALEQFVERCYARSLPVILVVGSRNVRDILRRTGILEHLSAGFVADTMDQGLQLASNLLQRITCRGDDCELPPAAQPQETASGPSPTPR